MKVVTGFVSSPSADAAIARAIDEVRRSGGELHLVSVLLAPSEAEALAYPAKQRSAEEDLDRYAKGLRDSGLTVEGHVAFMARRAGEAITEVAERVDADLVVIGLRRRSRVGKFILGSTAQDVLMTAHCPVLAVPAEDEDAREA